MGELNGLLRKVVNLDEFQARFCFFIDGLDEYHGDEEDLVEILSFFSCTLNIKLCVSSRPRVIFDEAFKSSQLNLVISDFIQDDMRVYVRTRLETNAKFKKLRSRDPACGEIVTQIAEASKGVWLWVFLVIRNLIQAVNRKEELQKIVDQFTKELEQYFTFIIENVKPPFREEMAQIFLIAINEIQPLPLYAFFLLKKLRRDLEYALTAPTIPFHSGRFVVMTKTERTNCKTDAKIFSLWKMAPTLHFCGTQSTS